MGFSESRFSSPALSAPPKACATFVAISDCTWNTSVIAASNGCCHFEVGASGRVTSTSSGLTWTRLTPPLFSQRTVAVRRYDTFSSSAICLGVLVVFL